MVEANKDLGLLRRIADGSEEALEELMVLYQQSVYGVALRLLSDEQAAEDVVQETFLSVWKHAKGFRGDASVKSWLLRIALNKARSVWRWRKVRRLLSLDFAPAGGEEDGPSLAERVVDASAEADPEGSSLGAERSKAIRAAIDALPPRQREIVLLRCEGLELLDIAKAVGAAEGTVKATLHHARQNIEKTLGGKP